MATGNGQEEGEAASAIDVRSRMHTELQNAGLVNLSLPPGVGVRTGGGFSSSLPHWRGLHDYHAPHYRDHQIRKNAGCSFRAIESAGTDMVATVF
ncbi:hypothetical protein DVH05_003936 [Phytophthora capsici]|nr:hypothetical protein DVH05_003936 [Phytophthora capsici]